MFEDYYAVAMRYRLILILFALITNVSVADEGELFNRVGTLQGKITIENHPEPGITPCGYCAFILQFTKCKNALIYVRTDSEGLYKVRIGFGRWKVIMRDIPPEFSMQESRDMLSPKQPHYVDVKVSMGEQHFDISIHSPETPKRHLH